jgi:hypothetical protein
MWMDATNAPHPIQGMALSVIASGMSLSVEDTASSFNILSSFFSALLALP